jgi:hypothetical protein
MRIKKYSKVGRHTRLLMWIIVGQPSLPIVTDIVESVH